MSFFLSVSPIIERRCAHHSPVFGKDASNLAPTSHLVERRPKAFFFSPRFFSLRKKRTSFDK
jgi:hypothetical protein